MSIGVSESISRHLAPTKGNVKNITELEWHVLPSQEAIRRLRSSETRGLDDEQAQRRLQDNGKNVLSPPPSNRIRRTYVNVSSSLMQASVTSLAVSEACCPSRPLSRLSVTGLLVILSPTPQIWPSGLCCWLLFVFKGFSMLGKIGYKRFLGSKSNGTE